MKIAQQNKAVFLGNALFGNQGTNVQDRIALKKQIHQKEAMHIVGIANKAEKKIDGTVEEHQGRIRELQAENEKANAYYNEARQKMQQAKEDYEIADDSQEQKDLELLQKKYDIDKHGSMELLTEDEQKRLAEMGEMTEYQQYAMDLYAQADTWKTELDANNAKISGESAVIRQIKIDRLKEHGMVDAEKAKEQILKAASDEAIAMMRDDVKETIDQKAEEVKEAAEERAEKKEEQEERVEAAKENKSEAEAATEAIRENVSNLTEQMTEGEELMQDVDEEVKKIMQEEKLLEEDLKGLNVNVTA